MKNKKFAIVKLLAVVALALVGIWSISYFNASQNVEINPVTGNKVDYSEEFNQEEENIYSNMDNVVDELKEDGLKFSTDKVLEVDSIEDGKYTVVSNREYTFTHKDSFIINLVLEDKGGKCTSYSYHSEAGRDRVYEELCVLGPGMEVEVENGKFQGIFR